MIKLVLLDVDGTLIDFDSAEKNAFRKTFESAGYQASLYELKLAYQSINKGLWEQLEEGTISSGEVKTRRFDELKKQFGLKWSAEQLSRKYLNLLSQEHELIEGALEICQYLKGRYTLVFLTNGFQDVQMNRIRATSLIDYVDHVVISETVGHNKPHPAIFRYALERAGGFEPGESIIIGDSLTSDMLGGIRYGLKTCWFNQNGETSPAEIKPDFEIESLYGLKDIL